MRTIVRLLSNIIEIISRYARYVQYVAACLMAVAVTVDVLGRFLFNKPLTGAAEIVQQLMVCTIFLILPYVTGARRHISVEVLFIHLPPTTQRVFALVSDLVVLAMLVLLTWQSIIGSFQSLGMREVTENLHLPHYFFRLVMSFGFSFAVITLLKSIFHDIASSSVEIEHHAA